MWRCNSWHLQICVAVNTTEEVSQCYFHKFLQNQCLKLEEELEVYEKVFDAVIVLSFLVLLNKSWSSTYYLWLQVKDIPFTDSWDRAKEIA